MVKTNFNYSFGLNNIIDPIETTENVYEGKLVSYNTQNKTNTGRIYIKEVHVYIYVSQFKPVI